MIATSDLWMLGLRPVRDTETEAPAPSQAAPPARSAKYVVAKRLGRWRVQRDDQNTGAFTSLDEAVDSACGQAREQAKIGTLAVVVVQSDVQEMHCFTPPASAHDTPPAPKLRVVEGASR
jgi:hypothetical protein